MSIQSKTIKPKNNFQFVGNYSNHCVWKELRNGSGAGADADGASRAVNMALSATDPLSEIVWSPRRGFSLNCVDSSFSDKNTNLYKDIRPSSMVLALLQSVIGGSSSTDMPIDDVSVNPITVVCTKSGISSTDTPLKHPSDRSGVIIPECETHKKLDKGPGGTMEKINAAKGASDLHNGQKQNLVMDYCEKNICDQANTGTVIISDSKGNKASAASGKVDKRPLDNVIIQYDEPKLNMEQDPSPMEISNRGMDIGSGNKVVFVEDGLCTKVEHIIEHEGPVAQTSFTRSLVEKLESTAENDLQTFNCEAAYAATSVALVSMSNEDRNNPKDSGMMQPCNKNHLVAHSPCNSRVHKAMYKGKEKSLVDGNANACLSKEENDEHLSVESCYSTGLFLTGKKRCNFQQQLVIGSKRVKKQIQELSRSTSKAKGDNSSFMNFISNMMKGFSPQSTQDESNPDHHLLWPDKKLMTRNGSQDPESKKSFFNSNFISMPSKDSELGNKVNGIDATPINFCADNNSLYNQYLQSDEFEASTRECDAGPSLLPKKRAVYFLSNHENRKNSSVDSKSFYHLGLNLSKGKEGLALRSSPTRQDEISNENLESHARLFHKSDTPEGLWMTRFSGKSNPMDRAVLPHSHKHLSYLNKIEGTKEQFADDHLLNEAKKLQDCFTNKEASIDLKDSKGSNDHTSIHKFNSITPFPGFRDSEPMASMFAKRLGAIKHIQIERTDSTPHRT